MFKGCRGNKIIFEVDKILFGFIFSYFNLLLLFKNILEIFFF